MWLRLRGSSFFNGALRSLSGSFLILSSPNGKLLERVYFFIWLVKSRYLSNEFGHTVGDAREGFSLRTQNIKNSSVLFFAVNSGLDRFGSVAVVRVRIFILWFDFYSHPFTPRTDGFIPNARCFL
jgi:hypothetical protein